VSYGKVASHKPKPSSAPQGIVDSYSTLPWDTLEAVTVVDDTPYPYDTCWITGLWSTQAKVEGSLSCWRLHGTGVKTAVS